MKAPRGSHRQRISVLALSVCLLWLSAGGGSLAQDAASGWTTPVNLSGVPDWISDSPVLLCDPYQNLHVVWMERNDLGSLIYYRTDATGSWSTPTDILALAGTTYLDAAITPDAFLHLVWVSEAGPVLYYARAPLVSAGQVREWSEPMVLASDLEVGQNVFGGSGTIVSDALGNLTIVYGRRDDSDGLYHTLLWIRSEDGGDTWSTPSRIVSLSTPEVSDVFPSLTIDGRGRLYVGWTARSYDYGAYSSLGYIRSIDNGQTWDSQEEIAVANTPPGVAMMGVYAFGDDEIHLTWDIPGRLHRWSPDGGESWSQPELIMVAGAAFGGFNQLVQDSGGGLHAVSAVVDGVFHVAWDGSKWRVPETIEHRAFDPHGQQLAVCQGNQLHVVYHDRTQDNELWYSSRTLRAPHLPRQPLPAPVSHTQVPPTASPASTAAEPVAATPGSEATAAAFSTLGGTPSDNSMLPVVVASGAAFLLVMVACVVVWVRRHG